LRERQRAKEKLAFIMGKKRKARTEEEGRKPLKWQRKDSRSRETGQFSTAEKKENGSRVAEVKNREEDRHEGGEGKNGKEGEEKKRARGKKKRGLA